MTRDDFLSLLPLFPDEMPDEDTRIAFLAFAAEHDDCARELAAHESMLTLLHTADDSLELPDGFASGWREAVRAEKPERPPAWYSRWQSWSAAAAAVCVLIGGTALMRAGYLFPDTAAPVSQPMAAQSSALPLLPASPKSVGELEFLYDDQPPAAAFSDSEENARALVPQEDFDMAEEEESLDDAYAPFAGETAQEQEQKEEKAYHSLESLPQPSYSAVPVQANSNFLQVVSTQLDADLQQLLASCTAYGGQLLSQSTRSIDASSASHSRSVELTLQLPSDNVQAFLADAADMGTGAHSGTVLHSHSHSAQPVAAAGFSLVEIELAEAPLASPRPQLSRRAATAFEAALQAVRTFMADMLVFFVRSVPYLLLAAVPAFLAGISIQLFRKNKQKKERNK